MSKKYACCMIYNNVPGNPARKKLEELRERKKCKNIYPGDRKEIGATSKEVLENSKKYAILIGSSKENLDGNAFGRDIRNAAQYTQNDSKKKILYTILDGNKDAKIVDDVKSLLDKVPDKQVQYLKKYGPEKMERFILKKSSKRCVLSFFILVCVIMVIACVFLPLAVEHIDIVRIWLSQLTSIWDGLVEWLNTKQVLHVSDNVDLESVTPYIAGTITVMPIPIIWAFLMHRENVSADPLFWLRLRRIMVLLLLLMILAFHKSAGMKEVSTNVSPVSMDFERIALTNLWGNSDSIYISVNEIFEPSGKISIEEDGEKVYISQGDKSFYDHVKDCPPLQEGHSYTVKWDLDIVEDGFIKFEHLDGKDVIICLDSVPELTDFRDITKEQFEDMTEYCGIDFSDKFKIYSDNNLEEIMIDLADADDSDIIFRLDIGLICLKLKDGHNEQVIVFELSPDNYTVMGKSQIPPGHATVTIEFCD